MDKKDELELDQKESRSYGEFLQDLAENYSRELEKNLFITPTQMFSSVEIKGLESMRFPPIRKKPWWIRWKYRLKDSWLVFLGKKFAFTQEEIDSLEDGGY